MIKVKSPSFMLAPKAGFVSLLAPKSYFSPNILYSAFCPFNFHGENCRFCEVGAIIDGMSESEKDDCRVENDVIEGGEDEVTKISTKPKKKTHAIKSKRQKSYIGNSIESNIFVKTYHNDN